MTSKSASRIHKELEMLHKRPIKGVTILPVQDDLHSLDTIVHGADESLYKGGRFKVQLLITDQYPYEPPEVRFLTPIYHLNVCQKTGQVCLPFLMKDKWKPTYTFEHILQALYSLLIKPEEGNAFEHSLLNEFHNYSPKYNQKAMDSASKAKA
ncbi:uncharacterized protein LOC134180053 [Corticium candelabrum]|uniref:uncharacterized protein LOC134180053 n=1 Tax=Corticium candelabrum TaxID=121492 RepID=UPI002E2548E2|nr:uncharacterized protein LOC134180053 [Corticium candelabrum]